MAEGFVGHAFGQVAQGVVVKDLDAADVAAFDAGFVGDGADNVAGLHFVRMAHLDAEAFHARLRAAVEGVLAWRTSITRCRLAFAWRTAFVRCKLAFTWRSAFASCSVALTWWTTLSCLGITRVAACGALVALVRRHVTLTFYLLHQQGLVALQEAGQCRCDFACRQVVFTLVAGHKLAPGFEIGVAQHAGDALHEL